MPKNCVMSTSKTGMLAKSPIDDPTFNLPSENFDDQCLQYLMHPNLSRPLMPSTSSSTSVCDNTDNNNYSYTNLSAASSSTKYNKQLSSFKLETSQTEKLTSSEHPLHVVNI